MGSLRNWGTCGPAVPELRKDNGTASVSAPEQPADGEFDVTT